MASERRRRRRTSEREKANVSLFSHRVETVRRLNNGLRRKEGAQRSNESRSRGEEEEGY